MRGYSRKSTTLFVARVPEYEKPPSLNSDPAIKNATKRITSAHSIMALSIFLKYINDFQSTVAFVMVLTSCSVRLTSAQPISQPGPGVDRL